MMNEENPYALLGLPSNASEEQIRAAFSLLSAQVKDPQEKDKLIRAYGMIRDEKGRRKLRWQKIDMLISPFEGPKSISSAEIESLAHELAFLSEWELGGDIQLKDG